MTSKSIKTRQRILNSAYKIAIKNGRKAATTREIAKEAEISSALIYYHFKTVDEVFNELYAIHFKRIFEILDNEETLSREPLYKLMAAEVISMLFLFSRKEYRFIILDQSATRGGAPFQSLIFKRIKEIFDYYGMDMSEEKLKMEVIAHIAAYESLKGSIIRSDLPGTPYDIVAFVNGKTFLNNGISKDDIEKWVPPIKDLCDRTKRSCISLRWLEDPAPELWELDEHPLSDFEHLRP